MPASGEGSYDLYHRAALQRQAHLCQDPARCICDVQELAAGAENPEKLADELSAYDIVLATEVGGGVVPMDPAERAGREAAGRLACLLAARADCVVQMFCGIPTVLKGELPTC